tara:strand:- start:2015 stop:2194 length:180 start_codon:yes stop_codon:yes gene_type:complete
VIKMKWKEILKNKKQGITRQLRKPDYIDLDKDGDKEEPMAEAAKDAKKHGIKHQIRSGE